MHPGLLQHHQVIRTVVDFGIWWHASTAEVHEHVAARHLGQQQAFITSSSKSEQESVR